MSFGEYVFSTGFIQKTVKADLHVRINCAYPPRNGHQKVLEDSKGHHTKVGVKGLAPPIGRLAPRATHQPRLRYVGSSPSPRLHLHRSLGQFDPRAHDGCSGLYKQPYTPLP